MTKEQEPKDTAPILRLALILLILVIIAIFSLVWTASKVDAQGVVLRWHMEESTDIDSFMVYRSVHPDSTWELLTSTPAEITEVWDLSLESGQRYWYAVTAVKGIIEGERSNTASAMEVDLSTGEVVDRFAAYYPNTDSLVLLVVYPPPDCGVVTNYSWEFAAFMDYLRVQCTESVVPVPTVTKIE